MKKTPSNTKRVRVNPHLRSNISDKLMDIQVKVRDGLDEALGLLEVLVGLKNDACNCPGNVDKCPECGFEYEYYREWADGTRTYTTKHVVDKYVALYGAPNRPFVKIKR